MTEVMPSRSEWGFDTPREILRPAGENAGLRDDGIKLGFDFGFGHADYYRPSTG